jgi:hypothetical protein
LGISVIIGVFEVLNHGVDAFGRGVGAGAQRRQPKANNTDTAARGLTRFEPFRTRVLFFLGKLDLKPA